ncbi:MAG: energy transducer TonB [Deltaproteobacteria bacterium]|nr:energy transducer TonB [Deltaproteobacteria bacterium]
MRRPLWHYGAAAGVSLAVNAALALLFLSLNAFTDAAHHPTEATATAVEFKPPPPPKRRPRPRPEAQQRKVPRVPPRIPNLPSTLQAPELLASTGDGGDIRDMLADELTQGAGLILTEEEVDHAPVPVSSPAPHYPERALDREQEGWVDLLLVVDQGGLVREVQVVDAAPAGVFDAEATAAVWRWRYQPAVYQGRPVSCHYHQRVLFKLR